MTEVFNVIRIMTNYGNGKVVVVFALKLIAIKVTRNIAIMVIMVLMRILVSSTIECCCHF